VTLALILLVRLKNCLKPTLDNPANLRIPTKLPETHLVLTQR
jgi:hypothetical protein